MVLVSIDLGCLTSSSSHPVLFDTDCSVGGRTYHDEEEIEATKTDPCVLCRCQKGSIVCFKKACPVLPCPSLRYTLRSGECCPRCRGSQKIEDVNGKCHLAATSISDGESLVFDPCTVCKCHNSTTMCNRKVCPPVYCPPHFQVALPDQCCYTCSEPEELTSVCMFEGRAYEEGKTWMKDPCVQCSCFQGQVICSTIYCSVRKCLKGYKLKSVPGKCCPSCVEDDGVCTIFGHRHYHTFDDQSFSFQGACKYLLAKDCSGNKTFSVKTINNPRHSETVSWTHKLRIKIDGAKVMLGPFLRVKINKNKVRLPFIKLGVLSVLQEGYMVVVRTNIGLKITWDGDSYVEVSVPPIFKNQLCGLCGNYNGQPGDDFIIKKGKKVSDVEMFGNFWKRGSSRQCNRLQTAHIARGLCYHNMEARTRGIQQCSILKSALFRRCFQVVDLGPYFRSDWISFLNKFACTVSGVLLYEGNIQIKNLRLKFSAHTGKQRAFGPIDLFNWAEIRALWGPSHHLNHSNSFFLS
ncbi:BMP-binding endothelial regulator protein-like [Tachypleus tridentatus]|uniref:BMP-binding endothelial regulator protein-like n=1 Tax=Tachypleus tridentatus TaxID=6853 RepID=UPI003FD048ED